MNANELRLGNWIYKITYLHIPEPMQKKLCYERVSIRILDRFLDDPTWFEPIPITPEILEMGGYTKHYRRDIYIGKNYKEWRDCETDSFDGDFLEFVEDGWQYVVEEFAGGHDGFVTIPVENVHSLQNIYYAIYREELNIQL